MNQDSVEHDVEFDRSSEHEGGSIETAEMMLRVKNRLRRHEGSIPHMYRDVEGNITVGVGFLLNKRSDVGLYSWRFKANKRSAPLVSAQADWFEVSKQFYGRSSTNRSYVASFYDAYTYVELSEATIGFVLSKKLFKLREELGSNFQDAGISFGNLPMEVQEAMYDMGWNLGAAFIMGDWPKLRAALKARNWTKAAEESHRNPKQVSEARNIEIRDLIERANRKND